MLYDKRWEDKPVVTGEPWRDVLRRAADLIEERGLAKFMQLEAPSGRMCLHGAISIAAVGQPYHMGGPLIEPACGAIYRYLRSAGVKEGIHPNGCAEWNNRSERTKEEVVAALRAAAEI